MQLTPDEARRRRKVEFVDVTGNVAVGKLVLEYPDVTLTDYLELFKIEGKWQIVARALKTEKAYSLDGRAG